MFGFIKNIFNKAPAAPEYSEPVPPVAMAEPVAEPAYEAPRPAPQRRTLISPNAHNGKGIEVSVQKILAALPLELQPRIRQPDVGELTITVPLEKVLAQLSRGAVKISFGELRQAVPEVFSMENDRDRVLVTLPLADILAGLNPALIARRRVQRQVEVPPDISSPFDTEGNGLVFSVGPEQAPVPAAPQVARRTTVSASTGVPPARQNIAAVPPPAAPSTPAPRSVVTRGPSQGAPVPPPQAFQPTPPPAALAPPAPIRFSPPTPPSAPAAPVARPRPSAAPPIKPAPATPPAQPPVVRLPAQSPSAAPSAPAAPRHIPPMARPASNPPPAVPANGTSHAQPSAEAEEFAPALEPETGEPILVSLTALAESWPEVVRKEIVTLNLVDARLALPTTAIERSLRSGKIAFSWKTLRSWVRPAVLPSVSAHDSMVLELPLKIVAPLFLGRQREASKAQQRVAIDEDIPNLFFGFPQPDAPSVAAATARPADTNYYVWEDSADTAKIHESEVKRGPSPGTKFVEKYATPNEVVSRAAALDAVAGALIALPDGLMVASRLSNDLNAETVAAFLPQIFGKVSQCTKELRMGELNNLNFTVGNIPWKIFRVNAIFFAAFGKPGEPLPTAQLAALAAELDHKPKL